MIVSGMYLSLLTQSMKSMLLTILISLKDLNMEEVRICHALLLTKSQQNVICSITKPIYQQIARHIFRTSYQFVSYVCHHQIYIKSMAEKVLVTGPFGQVGAELVPQLQKLHGKENVIALGHHRIPQSFDGMIEKADITDANRLREVFQKHSFTQVYHLAAMLSVGGEQNPQKCWEVNLGALKIILDLCVEFKVGRVFWASSMAVFGPTTPKVGTPQHTSIQPTTMYGVTKYAGELLAQYYFVKYGLDVRSLRYPGIISWKELPGGGTTDYAIGIFYGALSNGKYECFVSEQTTLPMIYMQDAINATLAIMQADSSQIKVRTSYNLAAISFSVTELADAIRKHLPLEVEYKPDHRQKIADSWPDSIDDGAARNDWGWKHEYGLEELVKVMLDNLGAKVKGQEGK